MKQLTAVGETARTRLEGDALADLVGRAQAGDGSAWDELTGCFTPLLWSVARSMRLETTDAADVVQVTWLRCVENLSRIRDPRALPAWLIKTCRREGLRVIALRSRERLVDIVDVEARIEVGRPSESPEHLLVLAEQRRLLADAIDDLPDGQRRVIHAFVALDGDRSRGRYRRIGNALGMPVGSIGPLRQRALARLRQDARLAGI